MACAHGLLLSFSCQHLCIGFLLTRTWCLVACRGDLKFIVEQIDKTAVQRLEHVAKTPFKRLSYTEAVEILEDAIKNKKKKFEFKVGLAALANPEHLEDA